MPSAVIIGGGVGGLGAALTLSRAGWQVEVIERDATELPASPAEAFWWDRRGAPQVRHSHAFLARLRNLLRDTYPDVLEQLLRAGASEIRFCDLLPEELRGEGPHEGDEDLVALACRRTTFEWVLRTVVLGAPRVTMRTGAAVTGLLAAAEIDGTPRVGGVRTDAGEVRADVTVLANGRRSTLDPWLQPLGVQIPEIEEDTGIVYLSRFYRLAAGVDAPRSDGPAAGDLGYLKFGVFEADDRTFSVTLAVPTDDRELRRVLSDPVAFDRAARACSTAADWIDRAGEPMTDVQTMAGLVNRQRRFLTDDGEPRVLGLHAVGDAHTATNPLYGRGCSLAFVMAHELALAVATHADDQTAAARAYEAAVEREVEPWYQASLASDRQARAYAAWLHAHGDDLDADPSGEADVAAVALLRDGLMPAVRSDGHVFRVFLRALNLLDPPTVTFTDPVVMARILECYQERDTRPPAEPLGPTRAALLETITA